MKKIFFIVLISSLFPFGQQNKLFSMDYNSERIIEQQIDENLRLYEQKMNERKMKKAMEFLRKEPSSVQPEDLDELGTKLTKLISQLIFIN